MWLGVLFESNDYSNDIIINSGSEKGNLGPWLLSELGSLNGLTVLLFQLQL